MLLVQPNQFSNVLLVMNLNLVFVEIYLNRSGNFSHQLLIPKYRMQSTFRRILQNLLPLLGKNLSWS